MQEGATEADAKAFEGEENLKEDIFIIALS